MSSGISIKNRLLVGLIAGIVATLPTAAWAVTYVWQSVCDESQINNSGVGDGSTDSSAIGFAHFRAYDEDPLDGNDGTDERVFWDISYQGLEGELTKLHVHGPAVAGTSNPGHILDVFSDAADIAAVGAHPTFDRVRKTDELFDIMLNSGGLTTGVPADHLQFMVDGLAYANIHTDLWPLGEIRCQLDLVDTIMTDPQTKDQGKCTDTLGKAFGMVAAAQEKHICHCIKARTKGKFPDPEGCSEPDGKVLNVAGKTAALFAKKCTGVDKDGVTRLPSFGITDDLTMNAAALAQSTDVIHDIFGPNLTAVIDDGGNKALGKCQLQIAKMTKKCMAMMNKQRSVCIKEDLKGKVGLPIVDSHGFELCMEVDRKGKIAKSCDESIGKIRMALDKKCSGLNLAIAAPGCATADPLGAARCMESAARCRTCLGANAAHVANLDCDEHDDGEVNGTCP